jgi:uncharacterized protein (TIGR00369 family)
LRTYEQVDEHMEKIRSGERTSPVAQYMQMRLTRFGRGEAVYEMPVRRELSNPIGMIQGGVATVLADAAMASATTTMLTDEEYGSTAVTTADIFVRLLGPVSLEQRSLLRAEGRVIKTGSRLVWAECDLYADDKLVGKFTGTGIKVQFEASSYTYDQKR